MSFDYVNHIILINAYKKTVYSICSKLYSVSVVYSSVPPSFVKVISVELIEDETKVLMMPLSID